MKASDIVKELQGYIDLYGDFEVIMRVNEAGIDDMDFDALSVYLDQDAERIVISDGY